MGQLTNLFVSESYQGLIKLANSTTGVTENLQYLQDGLGNNLPIQVSSTEVTITGSISNAVSSSYSNFAVSSSEAIHAVSASYAPSNPLPSGIVSGSSQISYTGITDVPSGIVSGSSQIEGLGYATTSSLTTLSSSIAVTDLAQNGRLTSLEQFTSSIDSGYVTEAEFGTYTGSMNSYTSSVNGRLSSLETNSGSQQLQINEKLNTSSFNSYTSSNNGRVSSLESKTGSYATTGSNVFQGTQTITGSLNVTGEITALSASITYLKTIYQTSSIVYSSGSNILGDEASDVQTLNGTVSIPLGNVNVTGAVTASAGFKGNLQGTSSYATQALSASYAPSNPLPSGIVSGSSQIVDLGFATTGSNTFNGNQNVIGNITGSSLRVENNTHLDGTLRVTNDAQFDTHILIQGAAPHLKLRDTSGGGFSSGYDIRIDTGSFEIFDDTHNRDVLSDIFNPSTSKHTTSLTSENIIISGSDGVTILGPLTASGSLQGTASFAVSASYAPMPDVSGFATTGSNTFVGNQIINGSSTQNIGTPGVDSQTDFITVSGATIEGKQYNYVNSGFVNYPGFGIGYADTFLMEYYSSLGYEYGAEFQVNGRKVGANLFASGSGQGASFSLRDVGNETTSFNVYADDIQIGEYGIGTSTRIGIGHNDLPNLYLKAQTINLSGSLDVVGDVGVNGSVGSKRFNFNGNPFNTNVGGTFGSINYDATNTSLSLINNDFSTPVTKSAVYATTNTGSNLTNVSMVADYAGTSAELKVQNSNGTRNVNVQTDTMTVTGSLSVSNGVTGSFRGDGSGLTGITATLPSGVVSGSAQVSAFGFATTGSNTFVGNQIVNGVVTQNVVAPGTDSQIDFISVSGATIGSDSYDYVNVGMVDFPGYGEQYEDAFAIEYYSSTGYEYGGEFTVNGRRVSGNILANGGGPAAFSIRDNGDTTTSFVSYADDMQIGEYAGGTNTRIGIGHSTLPLLKIEGSLINISGSTHMYSSDAFPLYVDGTINSKRLHFTGNPFNTDVAPNLGALRFDGTNTQFYLTNYDNTNLTTQSIVGTVVQTGSNLVQTFLGANNNNTNTYLRLTNDAGAGSLTTNVDVFVTGSLSVSNTITSNYSSGDEGGEIKLALPQTSTTLTGSITIDVNGNRVRIFETGGTNRGGYFDIASLSPSVGTNLGAGGGSVPSGTISGSAQIAALGYAITGSNTFNGSQIVTGSLSGNVGALSITSNTASMNTNLANFFTLTLPDAATHILPSNIKPGQTVSVKVIGGLTSTVTFPSSVKQPSGSLYVPTVSGTDILTFVSFDGTDIYMANVKKLI